MNGCLLLCVSSVARRCMDEVRDNRERGGRAINQSRSILAYIFRPATILDCSLAPTHTASDSDERGITMHRINAGLGLFSIESRRF